MAKKQKGAISRAARQPSAQELAGESSSAQETPASITPAPFRPSFRAILFDRNARTAIQLAVLAGLCAPVSQLNLAPVYGAVPSALFHKYGVTACVLIAYALEEYLPIWVTRILPTFAFWVPTIQFALFKCSSVFGNPFGPLITESATLYPLIILSAYAAIKTLRSLDLSSYSPTVADVAPALSFFLMFTWVRRGANSWLPQYVGSNILTSRIGLQICLAFFYSLVVPGTLFWTSLPSVAFTMLANVHSPLQRTTDVLNNTLALHNYRLLERQESITGYLSVLEDQQKEFRIMRCDHSLLGGYWLYSPNHKRNNRVPEPIYAVFTMLEAVRLVERDEPKASMGDQETALTIGCGIGTAPGALIAHGVNTTVIELDPAVHYLAWKYFDLPENHSHVIGDAASVVRSWHGVHENSYNYIIHDVFTGGVEPADLFTVEFLTDLKLLLKMNGVVAINYAGDLVGQPASLIYRTISQVFPSCRIFREVEAPESSGRTPLVDFTNMVFFCTKDGRPIRFRKPTKDDYLGTGARKEHLMPKFEIESETFQKAGDVLTRSNKKQLDKWQAKSAIGHWRLMRTVVPAVVWENW